MIIDTCIARMVGQEAYVIFDYPGDQGNRLLAWLQLHLKSIALNVDNALPEQALGLIYSGIDTLGLLSSPAGVIDANRQSFMNWCDTYILPRLKSVDGQPITGIDLYGARCGILHTSTPNSALDRKGTARQIWYQYGDKTGIDMFSVLPQYPLRVDIVELALAFRHGALAFLADVQKDPIMFQLVEDRAQHFMRWGTVTPSALDPAISIAVP